MKVSRLFTPLPVGSLILPNRLVMAPMALDHGTEQGEVTDSLISHYALRAKVDPLLDESGNWEKGRAGIGLLLLEHTFVNRSGKVHPRQLGIECDDQMEGLRKLTERIHREGALIGIQLSHGGARTMEHPLAPSPFHSPYLSRFGHIKDEEIPRELSSGEIGGLVKDFARAATRSREAGFDLIEIHGAHGYLLNQFYSPLTNRRKDRYGGCLEKRLRLAVEVISAVKEAVGPGIPMAYRLGADDRLPGGITLDDSKRAIPCLLDAGADILDISGGLCGYLKNGPEGFFSYMTEQLSSLSTVPLVTTGGIRSPEVAEKLVSDQKADLIGIGRAMLNDPGWACKAWHTLTTG